MIYASLHINKAKGNDAGTSAHIERKVDPPNADSTRTHLNKEFIQFPEEVENRTQAIQYRIEHAGIKRRISHNQIRALQVVLTGTHEGMMQIQKDGKLDEWCKDNIDWLQDTFGKENLVSAVLHMDEKSPHIHATVVPIVKGERRKAQSEEDNGKKKYRKKNKDTVRLCADDVMSRDKLVLYQDSYAEKMQKYGLQRGVKGSDARHISTGQYYRDLYGKNEALKENIEILQEESQEVYNKVRHLYDMKDEARDKFLNMDEYVRKKEKEIKAIESHIEQLKQECEPYKAQEELNFIHKLFPMMKEQLNIAQLCEKIGLGLNAIKRLLEGKTLTANAFKFYSPEHKQHFEAKEIRLKIEKEPDNPEKLRLSLNGSNIMDWFREKYNTLKKRITTNIKPNPMKKGRRL